MIRYFIPNKDKLNFLKKSHFYCLFQIGIPQYLIEQLLKKIVPSRGRKVFENLFQETSKFVSSVKKIVSVLHLSFWFPFTFFSQFIHSPFPPSFPIYLLFLLSVKNISYGLLASHLARVPGTEGIAAKAVVSVFS